MEGLQHTVNSSPRLDWNNINTCINNVPAHLLAQLACDAIEDTVWMEEFQSLYIHSAAIIAAKPSF